MTEIPQIEDHHLVESAQSGDRAAFELLVQRHQGAIYGYLRARLSEPADAEDLCQEVFLRSYSARARFDSGDMVRRWLIGIGRNLLREYARKTKRRKEVIWTELCLDLENMVSEEDRFDEVAVHLPGCIESLGPSAREALDLHYRTSMRLAEIGDRLRRSEGAIKLLMFRARQALKMCLSGKMHRQT